MQRNLSIAPAALAENCPLIILIGGMLIEARRRLKKDTDFDWTMKDVQMFRINIFFKHTKTDKQIINENCLLLWFQLVSECVESHSSTN